MRDEKNSNHAAILAMLLLACIAGIGGVGGFFVYRRLMQDLSLIPPAEQFPATTITFPPSGIVTFDELYRNEDADFCAEVVKATTDIQYFLNKPTLNAEDVDALNAATKNLETITELYKDRVSQREREQPAEVP